MAEVLDVLAAQLPEGALIQGDLLNERHLPRGVSPKAILRPQSTTEVSEILKTCHSLEQPIVPFGGLTGLVNGIGLQKKKYLSMSRSKTEIDTMKLIKTALDPKGILNPGKIF